MSLILRPDIPMSECMKLTAYAAVAAAEALESFGVNDVKIKWVNDLYLNGKKICGILTEGSADFERTVAFRKSSSLSIISFSPK